MTNLENESFKDTVNTIKENIKRTLDPKSWKLEGLSEQEIQNNIKRNMILVQALTYFDGLEINGKKVEGSAIEFDESGIKLGNKSAYLAMGGRVIGEFPKDMAEGLYKDLVGTDKEGKLLVSALYYFPNHQKSYLCPPDRYLYHLRPFENPAENRV